MVRLRLHLKCKKNILDLKGPCTYFKEMSCDLKALWGNQRSL